MGKNRTDTSTDTTQATTQSTDTSLQQPTQDQLTQSSTSATLDPLAGDDSVSNPIIVNR